MSSETDSSSSLSEQERKSKKVLKKLKKKSEKKHKKEKKKKSRKEKKHSRKDTRRSVDEDNLNVHKGILPQKKSEDNINTNDDIDSFGPALPPHLLNKTKEFEEVQPFVIGPMIPKILLEQSETKRLLGSDTSHELYGKTEKVDDLQGSYGPLPVTNEHEMTPAQVELEQRALELKMAAIDGTYASKSDQTVREEWMLELPNVGLKPGLAALNNLKRGFHQGKEKPDFSDRSSWTKTPNSCQETHNPKRSKEEMEVTAQALYEKQRDAEQEAIAKKHKKKHKREESLVVLHQKKLRAEEKKKSKELKATGTKPERRPFTRDIDLKLNKIDRNQTKQIVDKAKILNTKFSSGHSKYL